MSYITKYPFLVVFILGLIWIKLTSLAFSEFMGSVGLLVCFSLLFFVLVLDVIFRPAGIGYFLLVIFITLGFWLKLMLHLWLDYSYLEPTGLFSDSKEQWNRVLTVSMCGVAGMLITKTLSARFLNYEEVATDRVEAPFWYPRWRSMILICTALSIFLIPYLNIEIGIAQSARIPSLILPWPLNGLVAWTLSFGLISWVLTLAGWERRLGKSFILSYIAVLAEACLSAVSSMSRAIYIIHTASYIWILTKQVIKENKPLRIILVTLIVWILLFIATLYVVQVSRYFSNSLISAQTVSAVWEPLRTVVYLVVDRWVGLEGLMAVVAYPEKGMDLLLTAAGDRRALGELDLFTAEIAKISLSDEVLRQVQYASIPGAIAFFYYSGSLTIVFFGLAVLTAILIFSTNFVFVLTNNPYLSGFWSVSMAQTISGFGLGLTQLAAFYLASMLFIAFIWLLSGGWKYNLFKSS